MKTPNQTLRSLLIETIMRAKLLNSPSDLDELVAEAVTKISAVTFDKEQLLTEKEVSILWRFLDVAKLRNMRCKGGGPQYYKFGLGRNGRVFYRVADVMEWIEEHRQRDLYIEALVNRKAS